MSNSKKDILTVGVHNTSNTLPIEANHSFVPELGAAFLAGDRLDVPCVQVKEDGTCNCKHFKPKTKSCRSLTDSTADPGDCMGYLVRALEWIADRRAAEILRLRQEPRLMERPYFHIQHEDYSSFVPVGHDTGQKDPFLIEDGEIRHRTWVGGDYRECVTATSRIKLNQRRPTVLIYGKVEVGSKVICLQIMDDNGLVDSVHILTGQWRVTSRGDFRKGNIGWCSGGRFTDHGGREPERHDTVEAGDD